MKRFITFLAIFLFLAPPVLAGTDLSSNSGMGLTGGLNTAGAPYLGARLLHHYHLECVRNGKVVWVEDCSNRVTTVGLNLYLTNTLNGGTGVAQYVGLVGATATDGTISSSSANFSSASGAFTSADVGQPITVKGAGASGADLNTTISTYTSATAVVLANTAGTSVTTAGYLVGCRLADTMASHAPWTEVVPYSNANRITWTPGAVSGGSVSNSGSVAVFNINASATIYGAFMCDGSGKSGTTGNLLGMAPFSASRSVLTGDTLNVTITCSIS